MLPPPLSLHRHPCNLPVQRLTSSTPENPIQPYFRPTRGPWRDAQCLEPVTPTPGFSRICNARIQLFRENSEHFLQQPLENHIQFLDTLVKSAQRGCLVCALLLNKVERLVGDVEIPSELQLTYALGVKYVHFFTFPAARACQVDCILSCCVLKVGPLNRVRSVASGNADSRFLRGRCRGFSW